MVYFESVDTILNSKLCVICYLVHLSQYCYISKRHFDWIWKQTDMKFLWLNDSKTVRVKLHFAQNGLLLVGYILNHWITSNISWSIENSNRFNVPFVSDILVIKRSLNMKNWIFWSRIVISIIFIIFITFGHGVFTAAV